MRELDCPLRLWDYCAQHCACINNLTAWSLFSLHGQNPHQTVNGEEGDISNLCQYKWYVGATLENKRPGHAKGVGNEMYQWILKANDQMVPQHSVQPLHTAELYGEHEFKKQRIFDKLIRKRWCE